MRNDTNRGPITFDCLAALIHFQESKLDARGLFETVVGGILIFLAGAYYLLLAEFDWRVCDLCAQILTDVLGGMR
jgi:hypothetical protein